MRIGVIADIHDNIWALEKVLDCLSDCDQLLCLGDLCAPFSATMIAQGFDGPVHLVWGNNDGDRLRIAANVQVSNVTLHGELAELTLGGVTVALTHYPNVAVALTKGQQYDLVCHGHNHQREQVLVGRTLRLNPGEVMGRFGVSSYAIYDTVSHSATIFEL